MAGTAPEESLPFLYIDPLKQGLKQEEAVSEKISEKRFYT